MMRTNIAMALVASVSMISIVTPLEAQTVESKTHYAYESELRKQILESWTRNSWKSSCFIAENGLRTLINVNFNNQDGEHWLTAKKRYFFDEDCNKYADMEENIHNKLNFTKPNVNFFHLGNDVEAIVEYRTDGFFIQFGTQLVSFLIDNSNT